MKNQIIVVEHSVHKNKSVKKKKKKQTIKESRKCRRTKAVLLILFLFWSRITRRKGETVSLPIDHKTKVLLVTFIFSFFSHCSHTSFAKEFSQEYSFTTKV